MKPTVNDLGIELPKGLTQATGGLVQVSAMDRGDMLMHFGMEESMAEEFGVCSAEQENVEVVPHLI